jgi:hypothetical protein
MSNASSGKFLGKNITNVFIDKKIEFFFYCIFYLLLFKVCNDIS